MTAARGRVSAGRAADEGDGDEQLDRVLRGRLLAAVRPCSRRPLML
jgi:hypothetical protein